MYLKKQSEVNLFFRVAKELVELKSEKETKEDLRVKYALNKVSKSLKSSVDSFNEEKADLALDFCSVDSDKNVIIDEKGNYKFTPEKHKSFGKKVKELLALRKAGRLLNKDATEKEGGGEQAPNKRQS